MLARVFSACLAGVDATLVRVEVDVSQGLPAFATVGLPDPAVRESRDRVRTAIRNSGFAFPLERVTVNLAPADVRKEGVSFDLPIALGLLTAVGALRPDRLGRCLVAGELALDGAIHPVRGALPMALTARRAGLEACLVAPGNAAEAALLDGLAVHPVGSLAEAAAFLNDERPVAPARGDPGRLLERAAPGGDDFADVRGQAHAKRGLEIAAAGGHHVLLLGPPGTGKTLLARRLPTILPPLTLAEAIEVSQVWSVAGLLPSEGLVTQRPFRAPHHTVSAAGLIGGGRPPHPGEVSLAHHGALFLDELPEFAPYVLDTLRQPLEDGVLTVARAGGAVRLPALVQLVAAMNPCRRGCPSVERCGCTPGERARYLGRLSAPLLDRIDLHLEVGPVAARAGAPAGAAGESAAMRARVARARARQGDRGAVNARLAPAVLARHCRLPPEAEALLAGATERLGLSARAHDRVLRVARTIADLAGADALAAEHVAEALAYRVLDRRPG
ncbi:MAG TPA: YifB family Mg chelatase-like AAA ATPase [Methylomirabilota bacterium]|nr:YifB family Mg chelatase-like AAA ATPase [Methylomirabilota bacterium]